MDERQIFFAPSFLTRTSTKKNNFTLFLKNYRSKQTERYIAIMINTADDITFRYGEEARRPSARTAGPTYRVATLPVALLQAASMLVALL